jgi:serine/threonine protein kinase
VTEIVLQERYYTTPNEDTWAVGILLITLLTGEAPWSSADPCSMVDPNYSAWLDWIKRKHLKLPEPFPSFTARFLRLLKRILEPKPGKRSKIGEISKYLKDDWLHPKGAAYGTSVGLLRRTSTAPVVGIERHESNQTSKSGGNNAACQINNRRQSRAYGLAGKKRSTRSLKLDNELKTLEEPVAVSERVGRWVIQTTINQTH